jgi:hypothetical protein
MSRTEAFRLLANIAACIAFIIVIEPAWGVCWVLFGIMTGGSVGVSMLLSCLIALAVALLVARGVQRLVLGLCGIGDTPKLTDEATNSTWLERMVGTGGLQGDKATTVNFDPYAKPKSAPSTEEARLRDVDLNAHVQKVWPDKGNTASHSTGKMKFDIATQLSKLKSLLDSGAITKQEFDDLKKKLLTKANA